MKRIAYCKYKIISRVSRCLISEDITLNKAILRAIEGGYGELAVKKAHFSVKSGRKRMGVRKNGCLSVNEGST